MNNPTLLYWCTAFTGLLFVFAFGAICGSFINVVVYRVPKGLNIVTPPSACPACGTTLSWRENFPIFGWLFLGGKCRFCRTKISAEYPLIETIVALLFSVVFAIWFMRPSVIGAMGLPVAMFTPEWAGDGLVRMWPMLLLVYALLGSLVAITLIDARTFTIPLAIPWFAALLAFIVHPLHALAISFTRSHGLRHSPFAWTIATPEGGWMGVALGGAAGVGLSAWLLHKKVLPQSFADYPEWEAKHAAEMQAAALTAEGGETAGIPLKALFLRTLLLTGPAIALMFLGFTIGLPRGKPMEGMAVGMLAGLLVGLVLRRMVADSASPGDPIWVQYPHGRREMVKELLFLTPPAVLAAGGWWLFGATGPLGAWEAPLWLLALGGSLLGALVGGGLVWGIRIFGTLALGREAMGLGDVHLMLAVGAVLGWTDPVLAFFVAPFFGIAWAVTGALVGRLWGRAGMALPYGPHLAAATVVVLLAKPGFEVLLTRLAGRPMNLP